MKKTYTCAVITPVGPGHEALAGEAEASVEISFDVNPGLFSKVVFLRIDDPEGNLGRSLARNIGIMKAAELGIDWIFFLDADDLMAPEAFETVSPYIDEYDAIWGSIWTVEHRETVPHERPYQLPFLRSMEDLLNNDPIVTLQMGHFVKTSVAVANHFNETLNTGEDFDYYLRVWDKFKCIKIPIPLFYNRRGFHSTGPRSADGRQWRQAVSDLINAYFYKRHMKTDVITDVSRKTISLLCPTRGRPDLVSRFLRSVVDTATFPERIEILLYIDLDDDCISGYRKLFDSVHASEFSSLLRCEALWGEPVGVSRSWNLLASKCCGEVLLLSNDDQVYRDNGWDVIIDRETDKFPDGIYCMWFNDGINGPNLCAFPIISRRWYETLGYFTPEIFEYFYVDTWIMDIARRARRLHYIPHILVEHMHFTQGKSEYDATYRRNRPEGMASTDEVLFENTAEQRQAEALKLIRLINKFEK